MEQFLEQNTPEQLEEFIFKQSKTRVGHIKLLQWKSVEKIIYHQNIYQLMTDLEPSIRTAKGILNTNKMFEVEEKKADNTEDTRNILSVYTWTKWHCILCLKNIFDYQPYKMLFITLLSPLYFVIC